MEQASERLRCPFCGQLESERTIIDGKLLVIFPCMFSPVVDRPMTPGNLQEHLDSTYGKDPDYFRRQCDRLHLAVVKGGA